jgi:hypothetical protein
MGKPCEFCRAAAEQLRAVLHLLESRADGEATAPAEWPHWSHAVTVQSLARAFGLSRKKMARVLAGGQVRSRRLGRQSLLVDLRDVPAEARGRLSRRTNSGPLGSS